MKTIKVSA